MVSLDRQCADCFKLLEAMDSFSILESSLSFLGFLAYWLDNALEFRRG